MNGERHEIEHYVTTAGKARGWPAGEVAAALDKIDALPFPDGDPRLAAGAADIIEDAGWPSSRKLVAALDNLGRNASSDQARARRDSAMGQTADALAATASDLQTGGTQAAQAAAKAAPSLLPVAGLVATAIIAAKLL